MCDEAVDDFLVTLHFFPIGLLQVKKSKILFTALYADKIYSIFDEDFW